MHPYMLFAQIAGGRSIPSLFLDTGVFAKIILLVLLVISVISWAIILDRTRLFLRLRAKGQVARKALPADGVNRCLQKVNSFVPSIEGAVLLETQRYLDTTKARTHGSNIIADNHEHEGIEREKLRTVLERRALNEVAEMERHLIFLSTTSGAAPFLGLLGTVWGIMSSFLSMGAHGAASLDVVGPGIAEALVTTIAGLAAAIPALVGYNLLVRQVQRQETRLDLFISRVVEEVVVSADQVPDRRDARQEHPSGASVR